jgi:hypothetical protein
MRELTRRERDLLNLRAGVSVMVESETGCVTFWQRFGREYAAMSWPAVRDDVRTLERFWEQGGAL